MQSTVIYVTHDQVEAMTLADRIVIMRDGISNRSARPTRCSTGRRRRFVAGFIGSPPMNLIEATIADGRHRLRQRRQAAAARPVQGSRIVAGDKVAFGLRPDDIYPTGHGLPSGRRQPAHRANLPVSVTEPLGNETLVFVDFDGRDWVSRMLNPQPLEAGRTIGVSFDLARRICSTETGERSRLQEANDGEDRKGRTAAWSTSAEGQAHRCHPELRQPGNADRHHHRLPTARSAPATATRSAPAARRSCGCSPTISRRA